MATLLLRSPFLVLLAILLSPCLSDIHRVHGETRRPKNVQVAVRAKWEGTPILLEAGELIAKDWKDLYWEFVEGWLRDDKFVGDGSYTAKDCLKLIAGHGQSFLDGPLARFFEFSLTLRSASPRLVLYRQLAEQSLDSFPLYVDETPETSKGAKRLDTLTVGVNPEVPGGGCCWVDIGGALFFKVADFLAWLQGNAGHTGDSLQTPELFDFDHVYHHWKVGSPVAILYGALGTDCFKEFHVTLVQAAKEVGLKYVVRPVLPSGCETKAGYCGAVGARDYLNLGGYGVELALKNMEYKAMDDSAVKKGITLEDPRTEDLSQEIRGFIFSKILDRKPELLSEIMAFRDNLLSSTISDTLDIWELKDLGHQTVQRIVHASDPLQSMQDISQNFPSMVSSLSRMKLDDSVKDEITTNQRMIPPGKSLMALNGALVNIDDIDLYLMVDWLQQDLLLADQFSKLKVPHSTIRKLLSTLPPPESTTFRVDFRSEHVHYINNIEEDAMYKRWRSNINEILSPVFPGQLRYIRKNLFHTVYVVDPASACGLESVESLISYYENNFPMRFGLLLYSSKVTKKIELDGGYQLSFHKEAQSGDDISTLIIRLFLYAKETYGIQTAVRFLINLNRLRTESTDLVDYAPEMHTVQEAFIETLLPNAEIHPQDILLKLLKEGTFREVALESSVFAFKLGLPKSGCCILMNGLVLDSNEEALINAMNDELPRIQEQVYYGHINSHTDVLDKFLSEGGISRYNPQIIEGKGKLRFVSLAPMVLDGEPFLKEIKYLHSPGGEEDLKPVTHLLTVAITSEKGVKLLLEGIDYLIEGSKTARVGVLFSADHDPNMLDLIFLKGFDISVSLHSQTKNVLYFMKQLCLSYDQMRKLPSSLSSESTDAFIAKVYELASAYELPLSAYKTSLTYSAADEMRQDVSKVSHFLCGQLGIESGVNSIITNGRVTSFGEQGLILSHDLRLLEEVEYRQRVKHIVEVIEEVDWQEIDPDKITSKFINDVIMYVSSAMSQRERSSESARFELLKAEYSAVIVDNGNSSIHIDAVIDPLSPAGQKLAPLLLFFRKYIQPSMRIVLNPMSSLADLPLKNYYRYVFPTMDDFSSVDLTVNGPKAFFANMPLSKMLTMNLDVPEPWLIEPVIAVHDLDNILLENLGDTKTLVAVFELEALLLTGHCYEKDHDFPRGLQLILGTKSQPHLVDTLVMANLGYWQMKVFPGVLYLQLAPGRSSELYVLKEDDLSQINSRSKRIIINDLRGKVVRLEVVKKSGMEHEKLLVPNDDNSREISHDSWNSNILKWASGFIGGGGQSNKNEKKLMDPGTSRRRGKTINVFSIASGHLYERFLKIMILSVLKNTNRPVKFWFIKNYLSPQFKDVIPLMARDYGFEYELITYKWPTWLHKQKEKQRIIWAYKILFLDVIFPLSLEKVIFVDADQVVRADMGELYDMDINGRPLAYTPFCDNNKDMDGYRFWRQGFWKEHLRGRPYHISALYVVDLVKFRETAAGDNLRIFYESLSKDPNSLSNLDQDLPNYAQHTVPIFSLPQEWLWCESWCGNATKSKAKTIDLCNNPMTKEPKLQGARRIISEWVDLDSEARRFTAKVSGDEVDDSEKPISSDKPSQISASNSQVDDEDLETKAEL